MMRRSIPTYLLAAATVVAVGAAVATPALARPAPAPRAAASPGTTDRTIHVVAQLTTGVELDLGKKGPSPGDQFIFSGRLESPGAAARRVGRIEGYCVLANLKRNAGECTMTATLAGGQISVQGEQAGIPNPATATNAIAGGTGAFRRARGEVIQRFVSPPVRDLTFRLILQP